MTRKLYRSRTDRMIWGVCGGLASYFDVDPTIIRVAAIVSVLMSGAGIIAYIVMAVVVPLETSSAAEPKEVIRENVEEIKSSAREFSESMRSTFGKDADAPPATGRSRGRSAGVIGLILVIVGVLFLLSNLNFFSWLRWAFIWPVVLIAIGLVFIFRPRRK